VVGFLATGFAGARVRGVGAFATGFGDGLGDGRAARVATRAVAGDADDLDVCFGAAAGA
jgi:hypothetical protein